MASPSNNDLEQGYQASLKDLEQGFQSATASPINPLKGHVPVGVDTPSKFGRVLGIANEQRRVGGAGDNRLGPIPLPVVSPETKAALATPYAPTALGRLALNAGAQGASALAQGKDPAMGAAKGILGQAAGEGILKGASAVGRAIPAGAGTLAKFAEERTAQLVEALRKQVPAFKDIKSLRDMFYSQQGQDALHTAYDESLKGVIAKGKGKMIEVSEEAAKAFKIGEGGGASGDIAQVLKALGAKGDRGALGLVGSQAPATTPGKVKVDAAEAAKAMTGGWKKNADAYRDIADALDAAGIGDPAARASYKTAMGFKGFFDKLGGLPKGKMDIVGAQQGLSQPGPNTELVRRGLEGQASSILNPTGKPIEVGSMRGPGAAIGAGLGGTIAGLGLPIYGHGAGFVGGGFLGSHIGSKIPAYRNIPQAPRNPDLQMLLQHYLQGGFQQHQST